MEYGTCTTCGLQNKQSNEIYHKLTKRNLAASRGILLLKNRKTIILADQKDHFESEEQKSKKKLWYGEA